MKCIIPGTGIRAFGKCIYCLAKIGDEIFIETSNESLALKTVNPARSGFACFEFKRPFFSSFKNQNPISCKILSKCAVSVFRGLPSLEKSVDYCTVDVSTQKDKVTFVFHCKYGIKKTHQLGFEDCEALRAVYSKDLAPNKATQCSKPLQEALGSFSGSVSEITLSVTPSSLQLSNYIEDHELDDCRLTKSRVTLLSDEFQDYQSDVDTTITFCLKELRAILAFSVALLDPLTVQFETTGKPVIFSIEDNPFYSADFVLATLSDSETHLTQSQHSQNGTSNPLPSLTKNSTANSKTECAKSSVGSHTFTESKHSSSMSYPSMGMSPGLGNESFFQGVEGNPVVLSDNEPDVHTSNTLTTTDGNAGQLAAVSRDKLFDDFTTFEDRFVFQSRTQSYSRLQSHSHSTHSQPCSHSTHNIVENEDQLTQDSILDSSGFLPSTPPPSKKFKPMFSTSDMFGDLQGSASILAPDSEDEDSTCS